MEAFERCPACGGNCEVKTKFEESTSGAMIRAVSFWFCEDCPYYAPKEYGEWIIKPEGWISNE